MDMFSHLSARGYGTHPAARGDARSPTFAGAGLRALRAPWWRAILPTIRAVAVAPLILIIGLLVIGIMTLGCIAQIVLAIACWLRGSPDTVEVDPLHDAKIIPFHIRLGRGRDGHQSTCKAEDFTPQRWPMDWFIARVQSAKTGGTPVSELYDDYREWAGPLGRAYSPRLFSSFLHNLGVEVRRAADGKKYALLVALRSDEPRPAA